MYELNERRIPELLMLIRGNLTCVLNSQDDVVRGVCWAALQNNVNELKYHADMLIENTAAYCELRERIPNVWDK